MVRRSSASAVAERSGWRSRRARRLPARASAYAAAVGVAATAATVVSVVGSAPTESEWTAFAAALPLAAVAPLFRVAVGRNHSFQPGRHSSSRARSSCRRRCSSALVVALHLRLVSNDRYPWYITDVQHRQLRRSSALAAWVAVDAIGQDGNASFALAGLLAAAVFVAVNHAAARRSCCGSAAGTRFRESGLFSADRARNRARASPGSASPSAAFAELNPVAAAGSDRTARARAPLALDRALLRESEERFRTMFESAPTATMLFGVDGSIMAANRSLEALLGLHRGGVRC